MPVSDQQYPQTWLVLPAAGIGSRMQADRPKQYLDMTVKGITKTVIEFTLDHLLSYQASQLTSRNNVIHGFHKVVVVVTKGDPYWQDISLARGYEKDPRIMVVDGGSERCYSVLNALLAIKNIESDSFLVNFVANNMQTDVKAKQQMLDQEKLLDRAKLVLTNLKKELQISQPHSQPL